jgi:hypothetical protein
MLDTVKERASTVGEAVGTRANSIAEGVTQAVATAAGVVVGTVQALRPNNAEAETGGGGESGTPDVMDERDEYGEAEDVEEEDDEGEDDDAERTPKVSGM